MSFANDLPIGEAIAPLKQALRVGATAVLSAPPGAGKTTTVPLELISEPWVQGGKILVLEPRRIAARAAAGRMAALLGESVGQTVGYRVRMEARVGPNTRIEVVTEGVFTRLALGDPALEGIGAVLFDEFHERSLEADLGLALARDIQTTLRPDLRILVMSATLDGARIRETLEAPLISSEGRAYPVETVYLGKDPAAALEDQAAKAVRRALSDGARGVLVFLPGRAEILRTRERLAGLTQEVVVAPLYGALDPKDQDAAIAPPAPGQRKVVLATSIAETSLTIEGVTAVIDCGLSRNSAYDPASGLSRLRTERVSRAGADQRRGRAGRLGPGTCYRLWDEEETRALAAFDRPEVLSADLSGFALDLAAWGVRDPSVLCLLDPPPATAWREACALLGLLGAISGEGVITPHGRALSQLPLPPRLGHMVLGGAASDLADEAARLAALLGERGAGGTSVDLGERMGRLMRDSSPRSRNLKAAADRWARVARATPLEGTPHVGGLGGLLLCAFPERAALRRGKPGEFRLTSGRAVHLDPHDPLARADWLAVAELGGGESRDRILSAIAVEEADVRRVLSDRTTREVVVAPNAAGRLEVREIERIDRLVLSERVLENPPRVIIEKAMLNEVRQRGVSALPLGERCQSLRARALFAAEAGAEVPDLSDAFLIEKLEEWLAPLLSGVRRLGDLSDGGLAQAMASLGPWDLETRLEKIAPTHLTGPTGDRFRIDYEAEGGPRVEVRVQALFGLTTHPTVGAGRVPLTLALTSPAHRPIQVTKDLPGFWKGSWAAVRADLRGRYPKHPWPEDPAAASATMRAKPRGT